jgi:hypothetical protein
MAPHSLLALSNILPFPPKTICPKMDERASVHFLRPGFPNSRPLSSNPLAPFLAHISAYGLTAFTGRPLCLHFPPILMKANSLGFRRAEKDLQSKLTALGFPFTQFPSQKLCVARLTSKIAKFPVGAAH